MAAVACIFVIIIEYFDIVWAIPIAVLGAKAGVSIAFCFLYFSTVNYFSSTFLGLVMGFTNVTGRASTILAPIVAEMADPIPMLTTILLCATAFFLSQLLE